MGAVAPCGWLSMRVSYCQLLLLKIVRVKHTPDEASRVFEWRFVTHVVHAQLKSKCCLYVGALLGVWGIIPLFCA